MLDSVYDNDVEESKRIWEYFISLIKNDVSELNYRKNEIETIKKRAEIFNEIIGDEKKIIEEKSIFIEIDPDLSEEFKIIEFFMQKDNLRNIMARTAFRKILNNEKVKIASSFPITLNTELGSIENKVKDLNELLNGKLSLGFIVEQAKLHGFNDEEIKRLVFYNLHRTALIVDKMMRNDTNTNSLDTEKLEQEEVQLEDRPEYELEEEEVQLEDKPERKEVQMEDDAPARDSEEEEVQLEDKPKYEPYDEEVQIEEVPILSITGDEKDEVPSLENPVELTNSNVSRQRYDTEKMKYEILLNKNRDVIEKYYGMLSKDHNYYSSYSRTPISEIYQMGLSENEISKIIASKLFELKENTEESIKSADDSILNDDSSADYNCDYAIECMHEFETYLELLLEINERLVESEIESKEFIDSKLYFAHDSNGEAFIPDDEAYKKKIENISRKMDDSFYGNNLQNSVRLPNSDKESELLGKKIYMLMTSPSITYIKLNVNNEESRYILTANSRLKMSSSTSKLLSEHGDEILKQIELIELNDPEEMKTQDMLRKSFGIDEMAR